jgi:DNA-directed RNA polymerase subunit RPC12/RpoP
MSEPKCRKCGAPPIEAIVFGWSGIGEPVTSYDPTSGFYTTEDIDPADYAQVDYAECQTCGEQASTIHELMGMGECGECGAGLVLLDAEDHCAKCGAEINAPEELVEPIA